MKKYVIIFISLILCCLLSSCEKKEIALYHETPRICIVNTVNPYSFTDEDYVQGNECAEIGIWVQLQGDYLKRPMDFCLKANNDTTNVEELEILLEEKYTFSLLDESRQLVKVKVQRPSFPTKKPQILYVSFDMENPLHQFDPGRVDESISQLEISFQIKPRNWWDNRWGKYSDGKYVFMMDYFKNTYGNIKESEENCAKVAAAYAVHREGVQIFDNDGIEIVFPFK